jgi:hypothetical protein
LPVIENKVAGASLLKRCLSIADGGVEDVMKKITERGHVGKYDQNLKAGLVEPEVEVKQCHLRNKRRPTSLSVVAKSELPQS